MFGAVLAGLIAAGALSGQINTGALEWSAPTVAPVRPEFDFGSLAALTIPLVVMAIGMGNVQGLGVLVAQGYRTSCGEDDGRDGPDYANQRDPSAVTSRRFRTMARRSWAVPMPARASNGTSPA